MITSKDIQQRLQEIEDFLGEEYKKQKVQEKRDWKTFEQRLSKRIKEAIRNLEPLIDEAISTIRIKKEKGRKPSITLKQKVILLLLKQLFGKSNRMMASMVDIFSLLSGVDISYKTVERLYSDSEVEIAIHNLHVLILKKKGIKKVDASGDGTGYSLTIKKHYATEIEKRKDKAKKTEYNEKKLFIYSFKMLDLKTRMYIAYGTSFVSEKRAFDMAMNMLQDIDITMKSVRLDKYYSTTSYVDRFKGSTVYVIPRKNSTLRGSWKWKRTMMRFVDDTIDYLKEYYLRNNSESGFSVDKKWFGWKVMQKREDRIDTAISCTNIWHNMLNLYPV